MLSILSLLVCPYRYRKAPHHVFPAAYEDCLAVTRYVVKHALQLGVRQDAIMVAGDGAGGNLAAAVALALRDKLSMQVTMSQVLSCRKSRHNKVSMVTTTS